MPRYRVNYGETFDFWGQDVGEVVPELRSRHLISDELRWRCVSGMVRIIIFRLVMRWV